MTNNKPTYSVALSFAITALSADETYSTAPVTDPATGRVHQYSYSGADLLEKLTALKAQIEKRNSADRKPTKAQLANEGLKEKVYAVLTATPCTVSELMTRDPDLAALSNQKVSALVNSLVEDDRAVKGTDKRKSVFSRKG